MSTDISAHLRELESQVRAYYKEEGHFDLAEKTLLEMANIVETHADRFDEPKDRVRLLRARSLMAKYQYERLSGTASCV